MQYQYKVIVKGKNLYREFELSTDMMVVKLGTTPVCEFRMNAERFFSTIELAFQKNAEQWTLECNDEVYLSKGDMRKIFAIDLKHGDVFSVRYNESGEEAFEVHFMIDFESRVPAYEQFIRLDSVNSLTIGTDSGSDIALHSQFSKHSRVVLQKVQGGFCVRIAESEYGVNINGRLTQVNYTLQDHDFLSVAEYAFYYKDNRLYLDMSQLETRMPITKLSKRTSRFHYPLFNRNTRIKIKASDDKIQVLEAPSIPKKPDNNIVVSLTPSIAMIVLVVLMRGSMGGNGSSGTYVLFSACSMGLGAVTTVLSFMSTRKKYKKECDERIEQYTRYVDKKKQEISQARQEELENLKDTYHDTKTDVDIANRFDRRLFERNKDDDDFLHAYIGEGTVESGRPVDYRQQDRLEVGDELTDMPERLHDMFQYIDHAPVFINLKNSNAVGIVGNEVWLYSMFKNIVIDIAVRHYYGDVQMLLLVDDYKKYSWMRFLPHLGNAQGGRNIVCDIESKNNTFESLFRELTLREQTKEVPDHLVVLVQNEFGIKNHPISRFVEKASQLGVSFIFFEETMEALPLYCDEIVVLESDNTGWRCDTVDGSERQKFEYVSLSDDTVAEVIQNLAPVYCEEISLENSMRKNITLFELLHIYQASDLDLKGRWEHSQIYKSMAAPLGVNAKDEVVYLNLHEKAHGPHGLVAGTTGSGKSEILQSFIMSAATLFHPWEIGFVIIDFKGGGMANQFKNLPHLIGTITNIDGNEVQRSLKSIKAELVKRQAVFASVGVNHIDKYIKKFKNGEATIALPHLVIIVDEFAELKAEQPEFMKELISAARIGRSLGVHLILATQKPSGVVDGQIWSNSKFKLCLKVQSPEDSNEVLKTPLAAEIKEPGRAYLQVGNNEIFELFQSAYSGGSAAMDEGSGTKSFKLYEIKPNGLRRELYEKKTEKKEDGNNITQLDALVSYIAAYCEKNHIKRLPNICMPPLPTMISLENIELSQENLAEGTQTVVGLLDDPDRQVQNVCRINLSNQNVIIVGSSQTGKTNLLQTMIRSLVDQYSPKQLNLYIMDFGSMILRNFEGLPHVGGVVCASDDEKLKNLFKLLESEIENRKVRLSQAGVSSFTSYLEAGFEDMPQIVVMIDNMTPLRETYLMQDDFLMPLLREGVAVGVSFVITNSQVSGIGYRYLSNFEGRIALFCNDSSEYGTIIDGTRMKLPNIAGRALIKVEKEAYETQLYLAFEGEKEIERVTAIKEYVDRVQAQYPNMHAKRIPEIPDVLDWTYMQQEYGRELGKDIMPLGLDYESITPVFLDMMAMPFIAVVGNKNSKKIAFLKYFVNMLLNERYFDSDMYYLDSMTKTWDEYQQQERTAGYEIMAENGIEMLQEIEERLAARYGAIASEGMSALESEPWIVLVIDNMDAISAMSQDAVAVNSLKNIVNKYKDMKVFVIFSNIANENIAFNAPEILKMVKNANNYVIFEDAASIKVLDLPISVTKKYAKKLEAEDAYYVNDGKLSKLRMLTEE